MSKLRLSMACWNYDRTRALMDGRVAVEGVELNYLNLVVEETFFRMMRNQEFDVAEIKLSQPDTPPRTRLLPGGRIEGEGLTMHQIMQLAWDITTDELVANTPKWWDETKYSIVAKTSTAVSGSGQNTNVDIDDLKAMLRQLITDRFRLKAHDEERPVTAYTLVTDKPKMAKADPSNRTGFKEGPAPGQRDQRNEILGRMVTVRNMSMAQFAEDLQRIATNCMLDDWTFTNPRPIHAAQEIVPILESAY